jgi:Asp/Glu/hydantoin racemase
VQRLQLARSPRKQASALTAILIGQRISVVPQWQRQASLALLLEAHEQLARSPREQASALATILIGQGFSVVRQRHRQMSLALLLGA